MKLDRWAISRFGAEIRDFRMSTRDEFSNETKRVIAARVVYRCSKPDCDALAVGPTVDLTKHYNIGLPAISRPPPRVSNGKSFDLKLDRLAVSEYQGYMGRGTKWTKKLRLG
jgi:hypothetical protein